MIQTKTIGHKLLRFSSLLLVVSLLVEIMTIYKSGNSPEQNLAILAANPYPGRVLVMGFVDGIAVQAYAIGGRSPSSRNRVLVVEAGVVKTQLFDKSQAVAQPELILYESMVLNDSVHVVGNGDQTTTAIEYVSSGQSFETGMKSRTYEPDAPNFTPRISGFIDMNPAAGQAKFGLSRINNANN